MYVGLKFQNDNLLVQRFQIRLPIIIISFKATFIFTPSTTLTAVREVVKVQGNGVDLILDERVSLAIQICELDVVTVGQEQFSATDVLA